MQALSVWLHASMVPCKRIMGHVLWILPVAHCLCLGAIKILCAQQVRQEWSSTTKFDFSHQVKRRCCSVAVLATTPSPRTLQSGGQRLMLGDQPLTLFPLSKLLCYWETSLRLSIWTCVLWHLRLCSHSYTLRVKITFTSCTWLPTRIGRPKNGKHVPADPLLNICSERVPATSKAYGL